jgi:hypothetical protein
MSEREIRDAEVEVWKRSGPPSYQVTSDVRDSHLAAFRAGIEFANARRPPGPATAKMLAWANMVCDEYASGFQHPFPPPNLVPMLAAFLAEHEPAGPAQSIHIHTDEHNG